MRETEKIGVTSVHFYFTHCSCSINSAHQKQLFIKKKKKSLYCLAIIWLTVIEVLLGEWGRLTDTGAAGERMGRVGVLWSRIQSLHKLWMCSRGKHSISKCHMVLSQGIQLCACARACCIRASGCLPLSLCAELQPCDLVTNNEWQAKNIIFVVFVALAEILMCNTFY